MRLLAINRAVVLSAVCLGLSFACAWILLNPEELIIPEPSPAAADASGPKLAAPSFSMSPIAAFSEIAARPVFISARRPIPPPAPPAAAAAVPPPPPPPPAPPPQLNMTLVGVMIGGEGRYALVRLGSAPTVTTVRQGEEISGWRVFLILPDRVVLRAGATEAEVAFPVLAPNQPGVAPTVVTRPAPSPGPQPNPAPQLGQVIPKQPG